MDQARVHVADKANSAAGNQLITLEQLIPKLEGYNLVSRVQKSSVSVMRSLGYDEFTLNNPHTSRGELENRIKVLLIEMFREQMGFGTLEIATHELASRISKRLNHRVSTSDIELAVMDMSNSFGPGLLFQRNARGKAFIRNNMQEINNEQLEVLRACDENGFVTTDFLQKKYKWGAQQASLVIESMVGNGTLWVDGGSNFYSLTNFSR